MSSTKGTQPRNMETQGVRACELCGVDERLALRGPKECRDGDDAVEHCRAIAGRLSDAPRVVDDAGLMHPGQPPLSITVHGSCR